MKKQSKLLRPFINQEISEPRTRKIKGGRLLIDEFSEDIEVIGSSEIVDVREIDISTMLPVTPRRDVNIDLFRLVRSFKI